MQLNYIANADVPSSSGRTLPVIDPSDGQAFDEIQRSNAADIDSADCSIEAHAFAEAIDKFAALGATVIGVSADDIGTLSKFSVKSCQSRFPVASDEAKTVINGFDALMQTRPDFANRLSYVIAPDGKVAYYYQNLNPDKHVERMLNAVRALPKATAAK